MAANLTTAEVKADIEHVRAELVQTIHEVAKALAKRGGGEVLSAVAADLTKEAAALRRLAS
ncbi:hypothetical protein [Dongia rigui]|uniref:Uncharacterized protein n=1 Tax=Dongia rigui TaxID=940149 RepID=A0ABU5E0P0_9PROT|nr:hypothetical protein [Dongia rigui]MDY0873105.1 hypothetical protein [Dongia rigui]